jgi:Amt family ammonium transporter
MISTHGLSRTGDGRRSLSKSSKYGLLLIIGILAFLVTNPVAAQEKHVNDPGHTAFMIACTGLVLLMTPGLALFYGGMVRSKNILGTLMHSFFAMGIMTIVWVVVGYSIAFGDDMAGGLFGDPTKYFLFKNVGWEEAPPVGGDYPHIVFAAFQMMFAIITPALITGAFAERVKFRAYAVFLVLWSVLIYSPLCHWVWGGGILAPAGDAPTWLSNFAGVGAIDFAGGTVVHISSGVSALVFVLMIGKRRGYPDQPMPPNNLVMTMLGAGLLWFGWFGFNGGSQMAADGQAGLAVVVTHICAATGAVTWAVVEKLHRGKVSALGVASGLVAGLVCITPAAGFVTPGSALIMGIIVGIVCYVAVVCVKAKLGYDDSLDAFGVHGIGGTVGALLTGCFVVTSLNWNEGIQAGGKQLWAQAVATAVTWIFAGVGTAILVKLVDVTIGIRLPESAEEDGLDLSQHGEVGYNI